MNKIICILAIVLMPASVFAQNNPKTEQLTSDILNKATKIVYYEDTGSLPPEYEYNYTITVTKKDLHFVLKRSYGEKTPYNEKMNIGDKQYRDFIAKLVRQKIRKEKSVYYPVEGGCNISLTVYQGNTELFSGRGDEGLVASSGNLKDAFVQLLKSNMKRDMKKLRKTGQL